MTPPQTRSLYDSQTSIKFYETQYARGYMSYWPEDNKDRLRDVIRSLPLPAHGEALDFGCGNGLLTQVVGETLPGWQMYGTDISRGAVQWAQQNVPNCQFFVAGDPRLARKKFDFLFSYHVLEHVYNLHDVLGLMDAHLKPTSSVLHILPCGNEGSFEHSLCVLRKDGIDFEYENRFFYEVHEHVRRLTTDQLRDIYEGKNFLLSREYYSGQYYGGINWITQSHPQVILSLMDVSQAVDAKAQRALRKLRFQLIGLWLLRLPATIVERLGNKRHRSVTETTAVLCTLPLFPLSKPIDAHWKSKAREEWRRRRTDRNGSEMYLFFEPDAECSGQGELGCPCE